MKEYEMERWVGCTGEMISAYTIFVCKPERERLF
jgi:hypothetical protein